MSVFIVSLVSSDKVQSNAREYTEVIDDDNGDDDEVRLILLLLDTSDTRGRTTSTVFTSTLFLCSTIC